MLDKDKMWQVQQPELFYEHAIVLAVDSWLWSLRDPMRVPDQPTAILPAAMCRCNGSQLASGLKKC